ncbi:MAG TPA: CDP-diacylglycerol--glycerol-3-phosphate 3-phosphatidyltransferase [Candidatus Nanoarchaeia archaeon]|nr:CDP-diacylglycerol--glycerol-3-phosphate 3-phosphatidyltransferase [Candidatus Nanoarchaeia archaeon]
MVNWANLVTMLRIAFIPVFVFFLYTDNRIIALVIFCILAASDALDGYLARKFKTTSRFGILLDPLADKLLVVSALIFLIGRGIPAWMAWVIIIREFFIVGLRMLLGRGLVIPASFLGKAKTTFEMAGIIAAFLTWWIAWWILLVAIFFSLVSAVDYLWLARKALKRQVRG